MRQLFCSSGYIDRAEIHLLTAGTYEARSDALRISGRACFLYMKAQNASISVPIIRNAFAAVILRKECLPQRDLTARNARLPATTPATALFMQHSVLLLIGANQLLLKVYTSIICKNDGVMLASELAKNNIKALE